MRLLQSSNGIKDNLVCIEWITSAKWLLKALEIVEVFFVQDPFRVSN